jgi:hypothetical protein
MTMKKIQKRIWEAYVACERLCESDRDADAWFRKAFEEARAGEQRHRAAGKRFTNGAAAYRLPVADAARFFAVKWFLDTERGSPGRGGQPLDFADACALRTDSLYALGARDRVLCPTQTDKLPPKAMAWHKLREEYADVAGLDYSEVFAA